MGGKIRSSISGFGAHFFKKQQSIVVRVPAVLFAFIVLFFDGFALIVRFFARGEHDFKLRKPAVGHVKFVRDDGHAALLDPFFELPQLRFTQQKRARPAGFVVHARAMLVFGDIHRVNVQNAVVEQAIRIAQIGLARPDALDLGASENDARLKFLLEMVLERGAAVGDLDFFVCFFLLSHDFFGAFEIQAKNGNMGSVRSIDGIFFEKKWRMSKIQACFFSKTASDIHKNAFKKPSILG